MEKDVYIKIEPSSKWRLLDFKEVKEFRELLFFLVWRDLKVRYKQTVLGALWAILQPLFTMLIFTVIFGIFAKIPSDGVNYAVFSFSGLILWNFFSGAVTRSSGSLVANSNMIKKVYFPRIFIPLSSTISGVLDFLISLITLLILAMSFDLFPSIKLLWFPVILLVTLCLSTGIGLLLSSMNVKFRDIGYIVPFLVQIWMYLSPIVYPVSLIPEQYHWIYGLNPMVGIIEMFRHIVLNTGTDPYGLFLQSAGIATVALFIGMLYFSKTEKLFADVV